MFHLDVAYVLNLDVAKVDWDVAHVAMAIHVCCKCMFQMFHLFQTYVASVLSGCCICCSRYILMLQVYIFNVSPVSDVCCSKCFIL